MCKIILSLQSRLLFPLRFALLRCGEVQSVSSEMLSDNSESTLCDQRIFHVGSCMGLLHKIWHLNEQRSSRKSEESFWSEKWLLIQENHKVRYKKIKKKSRIQKFNILGSAYHFQMKLFDYKEKFNFQKYRTWQYKMCGNSIGVIIKVVLGRLWALLWSTS